MKLYTYNASTGELICEVPATESPLQPGVYLDQAFATRTPPPMAEAGKTPAFRDGAWSMVPDHRGETWYDSEGVETEVDFIGDPSAHELLAEKPTIPETPPTPEDLAAYTAQKSWETRVAGPLINGVRIKCDGDAIGLINGMADLAERDPNRTFRFDAYTDGTAALPLTASEAITFAEQIGEWAQLTFDRRAAVYTAITSGTVATTADVDAAFADVTDDWPA